MDDRDYVSVEESLFGTMASWGRVAGVHCHRCDLPVVSYVVDPTFDIEQERRRQDGILREGDGANLLFATRFLSVCEIHRPGGQN